MHKIKKFIKKCKRWIIVKLGGITDEGGEKLIDACFTVHMKLITNWRRTVQEICRRSDNTYYDWCCEFCGNKACKRPTGWCEDFTPKE